MSEPRLVYSEGFDEEPPRLKTVRVFKGGWPDPEQVQVSMDQGALEGVPADVAARLRRIANAIEETIAHPG